MVQKVQTKRYEIWHCSGVDHLRVWDAHFSVDNVNTKEGWSYHGKHVRILVQFKS